MYEENLMYILCTLAPEGPSKNLKSNVTINVTILHSFGVWVVLGLSFYIHMYNNWLYVGLYY